MHKTISFFGAKFNLFAFVCVVVATCFLVVLGNWQLSRLEQKTSFINAIEQNIVNPAINVSKISLDINYYSKIRLEGRFLKDKNIFLYGRRSASPEKDGYYLLSVFETINNDILLVSRGWIPQSVKDNFSSYEQSEDIKSITGFALPHEEKSFLVPDNDLDKNIWFNINLQMSKEHFGTNIERFYLMQIDSDDLPSGAKALTATNLNKVRNDHLEYAITWFSLAGCLVLLFIIYGRQKGDSIFSSR